MQGPLEIRNKEEGLGLSLQFQPRPQLYNIIGGGNAFFLLREHDIHLSFCTAALSSHTTGSPTSPSSALAAPWTIPSATRFFLAAQTTGHTARSGSARDTHLTSPRPYTAPLYYHCTTTTLQSLVDRMHGGGETRDNAADFLVSRPGGPYCPTTT